jgi:hypothetical protein
LKVNTDAGLIASPAFLCYIPYTGRWFISSEKTGPRNKQPVTWHTAFYDAIRLELFQYRDVLSFELLRANGYWRMMAYG